MNSQVRAWIILSAALLASSIIFGWLLRDAFYLSWPGALLVGALFVASIIAAVLPAALKKQMIRSLPDDMMPVVVQPADFPQLDRAAVEKYTDELRALGFTSLCDYGVHSPTVELTKVFARAMVHDEHGCIAEINQYFASARPLPVSVTVQSFFGDEPPRLTLPAVPNAPLPAPGASQTQTLDEGDFWIYTTHNHPPHTLWKLLRRARMMGRRMPGANAQELLRQHLTDRAKIAALLRVPPSRDLTIEHYFAWGHYLRQMHRQQLQYTNFYMALPRAYFDDRNEWWGELNTQMQKAQ